MRFDTNGFIRDVTLAYQEEIRQVLTQLYAEVVKSAPTGDIASSVMMKMEQEGLEIIGQVFPEHWTAIMHEWGSGSLMDVANPDLADYKQSIYWNPARPDHYIRGRPKGSYLGIDDRVHTTKGTLEGVNLEHRFKPIEPKHFVRKAVDTIRPIFLQKMEEVLVKFPVERYVIDT